LADCIRGIISRIRVSRCSVIHGISESMARQPAEVVVQN